MTSLFEPAKVGSVDVSNRVFMAPLTRNRANAQGVPSPLAAEYYAQRASGGLLISEATQISPQGKGYLDTPGIHSDEQVAAWKKITAAVHEKGGKIFLQLWHVGRISHTSLQPEGAAPVAPSAIRAKAQTFTADGFVDVSEPRALILEEIQGVIRDYEIAAKNAMKAGFDGVEVHGANGYLLDQFLHDGSNKRTDQYGGSAENRVRLLREVVEVVVAAVGADKVGVRLSPTGSFNDVRDSDPLSVFGLAIEKLNGYGLAYLHMVEKFPGIENDNQDAKTIKDLRALWKGFYIANGGFDADSAKAIIESGYADAIAFGRPFIANPDLPKRLEIGAALNEPDQSTFYGGGAKGYTDYPFLDEAKAA